MKMRSTVLACLLLCCLVARASEIFMWVDERGRVQISDVVPEKYRASARKVDSQSFELTPQQRAEAQTLAAQDKQKAAQVDADIAAQKRQAAASRRAAGAAADLSRPAPSRATDCVALQRAYVRSQECFAPYITVDGGVKEEAFAKCKAVVDPSGKCGIQPLE